MNSLGRQLRKNERAGFDCTRIHRQMLKPGTLNLVFGNRPVLSTKCATSTSILQYLLNLHTELFV